MDTNGKVVEVLLAGDGKDNGFFDFFAKQIKRILPYGGDLISQNNKQKSIVVKGNEFWVCQYFYNPNIHGLFDDVQEINMYASIYNGELKGHIVMRDNEIPDTDIYRVGTLPLWVALCDFICIPTTAYQRNELANKVAEKSNGRFVYEEQRHDIRSYHLGRSATIQEISLLLSSDKGYMRITRG